MRLLEVPSSPLAWVTKRQETMDQKMFGNTVATNGLSHRSNFRRRKLRKGPVVIWLALASIGVYVALIY